MRRTLVLIGLVASLTACASCSVGTQNERYRISSPSMEPTIAEGSTVTAEVVKPGAYQPRTGDVVVFEVPDTWRPAEQEPPRIYRVVAVPGDTVSCCDDQDRIIRNGTPQDEPYIRTGDGLPPDFQAVTVPPGTVYLLGDNRGVANDSSQNGPLPTANVIGVVKL
ncbi:signal peptidase I [Plantactinospora sp. B24E8]|uniref:signal peptidase I n=1 Tax=Plantactinospora sp. B24E8 TaxID=3153567 RepID=UPI00325DF418